MKGRKGLTLIELLVVVIILGALAVIAIPRLSQSSTTAKEKACFTNIDTINTQVELYHANSSTGSWPATIAGLIADPNYFPETPTCPSGGAYDYYGSDYRVECSIHGH